ncbi:MAG: hypothetical protein L3K26_03275 [Candidatus Hydrogenedentes bacterium]|nr:hypothetical protein [Candidatus Hydrogenedentota bacterium]
MTLLSPAPSARPAQRLWCVGVATIILAFLFLTSTSGHAGETDQFLTWNIELEDSAEAFNVFLDQEIHRFVERANQKKRRVPDTIALTKELYRYLFQGLHASRVRYWLKHDDTVDRYPSDDLSDLAYQRISIFRKPAFPFLLPMAQTVRIGGVYCGIDKIGHMLGFGRRYFQIYYRHRDQRMAHKEAVEKVIQWGIQHETNLVGKLVDGIFSHGDMEANYQGFRMALAFCQGDNPLFYREDGRWKYRGGLDIRDYVTPDFDESYNPNHYASWRHRRVAPVLSGDYGDSYTAPIVQRRFERYRTEWEPSLSKKLIDAHFDALKNNPQHSCWSKTECDAHS